MNITREREAAICFTDHLVLYTSVDKHWVNELWEFTGLKVECTSVRGHYEQDSNFTTCRIILYNLKHLLVPHPFLSLKLLHIKLIFVCTENVLTMFSNVKSWFSRLQLHWEMSSETCVRKQLCKCGCSLEVRVVLKIISRSHRAGGFIQPETTCVCWTPGYLYLCEKLCIVLEQVYICRKCAIIPMRHKWRNWRLRGMLRY